MPPRHSVISGYVAGDKMDQRRTVPNIPVGRALIKAWMTVKTSPLDLDAAALVQKIITTTPAANIGHIEDDGATDQSGVVLFQFTPTDTGTTLGPDKTFFYDIQLKYDNSDIATLEYGEISFVRGVTDAAS